MLHLIIQTTSRDENTPAQLNQVWACGDIVTNEETVRGSLARVKTIGGTISNAKIVGEVIDDG